MRWVHGRGQTFLDPDDNPARFTGLLVDVTDRKHAEERLRIAQSTGGVGTFEYAEGHATVSVSDEFCRLLGLHPAGALPVRTINALVAPGQQPLIPDIERGCPAPENVAGDFRVIRADTGDSRWIARRGELLRDPAGSGYSLIGVIYDITDGKQQQAELRQLADTLEARVEQAVAERQHAEEELRQALKMEAIGRLTGGIAHDFNNLLAGISGALEMMQIRISQGRLTELDRYVNTALSAATRAAALTHRLLAFSRRQTLSPTTLDVNKLVRGLEELIRRTAGPSIQVETICDDKLWRTFVDANQLENALLNLSINARDAMPDGGKLTIETSNSSLNDRAAPLRGLTPGDYVRISVTDTGVGMPQDVIDRAFDPFFTTKPLGKGTGLGLSMVYGFAQQSGGQAHIHSELGQGTVACIYLPRKLGEQQSIAEPTPSAVERAVTGETVLVVDDEPTVRMLIGDALRDLGYFAIEAADGAAALKILEGDSRVDLLITDVGLPGAMNGRQLVEAARSIRSQVSALFITGYSDVAVLNHRHMQPGTEVLRKPFAMDTLARYVRLLLEQRKLQDLSPE